VATPSAPSVGASGSRPSSILLTLGLVAVLLVWSINYIVGKITLKHLDRANSRVLPFSVVRRAAAGPVFQPARAIATAGTRPVDVCLSWIFRYAINQGSFVIGLSLTTSAHSAIIVALGDPDTRHGPTHAD